MMNNYTTLLRLLQQEMEKHEALLELLSRERAAIVKMEQETIEEVTTQKVSVIGEAQKIEKKRNAVIEAIAAESPEIDTSSLSNLIERCVEPALKRDLNSTGEKLKEIATTVHKMNSDNARLVKDSQGLIATTLAIMLSPQQTELPTYGQSGKLKEEEGRARGRTRTSA